MTKCAELANLIGNINAGGGRANRNFIINGAMNVAQRATSSTGLGGSDGYFTCDRWATFFNTAGRLTMSQDTSVPTGKGFTKSLKLDCTTADTSVASGEYFFLAQRIEGQKVQAFAKGTSDAKPFAVSFYVKGNASATYVAELFDSDNSRQISKTFTVGTDWARVELSFPADTTGAFNYDNGRSLDLNIWLHAGSDYTSGTLNSSAWASSTLANRAVGGSSFFDSTDRTFFLTGVQLEVGQNPTEFEHINSFGEELTMCKRYYQKLTDSYAQHGQICNGHMANSTQFQGVIKFVPQMRAAPSLSHTTTSSNNSSSAYYVSTGGSNDYVDALSFYVPNQVTTLIYVTSGSSATEGDGANLAIYNTITECAAVSEL